MPQPAFARPLRDPSDLSRLSCSFCGETADHVRFLTAGASGGMICDRCWGVASFIFVKAYLTSLFAFLRPQSAR
ncbi:MAG TPA: ClpX C4-type zinc finger protein [Vicinamibacteria bacterium]|nr:ClpX C4-type zinc finger protein [Vicinamibacteria bacterium]